MTGHGPNHLLTTATRVYAALLLLPIAALLAVAPPATAQPAVDEYALDVSEINAAQGTEPLRAESASTAGSSGLAAMLVAIVLLASICVAAAIWRMRRQTQGLADHAPDGNPRLTKRH
jgi:ABC-type spermidine/putrescine transport system permease subunit II